MTTGPAVAVSSELSAPVPGVSSVPPVREVSDTGVSGNPLSQFDRKRTYGFKLSSPSPNPGSCPNLPKSQTKSQKKKNIRFGVLLKLKSHGLLNFTLKLLGWRHLNV